MTQKWTRGQLPRACGSCVSGEGGGCLGAPCPPCGWCWACPLSPPPPCRTCGPSWPSLTPTLTSPVSTPGASSRLTSGCHDTSRVTHSSYSEQTQFGYQLLCEQWNIFPSHQDNRPMNVFFKKGTTVFKNIKAKLFTMRWNATFLCLLILDGRRHLILIFRE